MTRKFKIKLILLLLALALILFVVIVPINELIDNTLIILSLMSAIVSRFIKI